MKYCSAQIEYTDKNLNLIPFKKVIERSGSADCRTNTLVKGCKNFNKGQPVSEGTNRLTAGSENTKE